MPNVPVIYLLVIAVLTGGLGVAVLQRIFSKSDERKDAAQQERAAMDAAAVEFFKLQFEQIGKDRDDLREELRDCRVENRRLNDKIDSQAAEFYELKGKHDAGRDQLERITGEYFALLQKYTAALLETEVLRAALKEHGIETPDVTAIVKRAETAAPSVDEIPAPTP